MHAEVLHARNVTYITCTVRVDACSEVETRIKKCGDKYYCYTCSHSIPSDWQSGASSLSVIPVVLVPGTTVPLRGKTQRQVVVPSSIRRHWSGSKKPLS